MAVGTSISYPTSPTPRMLVEVSPEKLNEESTRNVYAANSGSPEGGDNIAQQNTADDKVMYI